MSNDERAPGIGHNQPPLVDVNEPFLTPEEAVEFLGELGLPIAKGTLAKLRCIAGGPIFQNFGRWPRYKPSRLREFAASKLTPERRSSSEDGYRQHYHSGRGEAVRAANAARSAKRAATSASSTPTPASIAPSAPRPRGRPRKVPLEDTPAPAALSAAPASGK